MEELERAEQDRMEERQVCETSFGFFAECLPFFWRSSRWAEQFNVGILFFVMIIMIMIMIMMVMM